MKQQGERYSGVTALFNADLHAIEPLWAPREDWLVLSNEEILHIPGTLLEQIVGNDKM